MKEKLKNKKTPKSCLCLFLVNIKKKSNNKNQNESNIMVEQSSKEELLDYFYQQGIKLLFLSIFPINIPLSFRNL